ncbi:MAG: M64 family metallopeptidase [Candidatus Peregrinibacteria bacterium]
MPIVFKTVFKGDTQNLAKESCNDQCPVGKKLRYCCNTTVRSCEPMVLSDAQNCSEVNTLQNGKLLSLYSGVATKDRSLCQTTCTVNEASSSSAPPYRTGGQEKQKTVYYVIAKWLGLEASSSQGPDCLPLYENGNPDPTANKVNVVIRFVGDTNLTEAQAQVTLLQQYAPFATVGNQNKLQFWYFKDAAPLNPSNPQTMCPCESSQKCTSPALENAFYIDLRDDICRPTTVFGNRTCIGKNYYTSFDANQRVFVHELGHLFGGLADEYTEKNAMDNNAPPNCAPGWMFPTWNAQKSAQEYCLSAISALRSVWWSDLLPSNLEAACQLPSSPQVFAFRGCSYNETNIRPTYNSLMRNHWEGNAAPPQGFQPVNIRWMNWLLAFADNAPSNPLPAQLNSDVLCPPEGETALRLHLFRNIDGTFTVSSTAETLQRQHCVLPRMLLSGLAVTVKAGDRIFTQMATGEKTTISENFTATGISLDTFRKDPLSEVIVEIGMADLRPDGLNALFPDGTIVPITISVEHCGGKDESACPAPMLYGKTVHFCPDGSLDQGSTCASKLPPHFSADPFAPTSTSTDEAALSSESSLEKSSITEATLPAAPEFPAIDPFAAPVNAQPSSSTAYVLTLSLIFGLIILGGIIAFIIIGRKKA